MLQEEREIEQEFLEDLKKLTPEVRRSFYKNVLIVFDDMVGDIKKNEFNPEQLKLFLNRRHLIHNGMVSIIILSQKYSLVPSRIRSNCNWMICFRLNPKDVEFVYQDCVNMEKDKWE